MSTEHHKQIIRQLFAEVSNKHNPAAAGEFWSENYVNRTDPHQAVGIAPLQASLTNLYAAFPDFHEKIRDLIAEGDKVVAYVTVTGTHQGSFMGMPPSGRTFSVELMEIFRLEAGKVQEMWIVNDMLGLLQQLGALPTPGQPAEQGR
jgi:steroid delta-isomerase-like uncharacterized protein